MPGAAAPAARRLRPGRWGAQYSSLWVTRGGGGTFNGVWTPTTYARAGFYVSDTTTPGHVYELSAEHHLFSEIKLDRVENWDFHGPQTEEEASTSAEAVSLEINDSKNITIANYHAYRVARSYAPEARFSTPANREPRGGISLSTAVAPNLRGLSLSTGGGWLVCPAVSTW